MKQSLLYLLLGIFLLASCQQEELPEDQAAYGYLSLKSVVATVENVNQPASRALPSINTEDLYVEICEGDKTVLSYEPGKVPAQIPLPIGTYTAKAYNAAYQTYESLTDGDMGEAVFYGETELFTIEAASEPTTQTIKVSLYNFGIAFALDENFKEYFDEENTALTLSCNNRSVTYDLQQKNYAYFYLEEGASLSYTLSSQNKDGETVTLPGTLSGTQKGIANGKCYTLTFTFNPESRSLSVAD